MRAGDDFLARPAFAADQDGYGVAFGDQVDFRGGSRPSPGPDPISGRGTLLLGHGAQGHVLANETAVFECAINQVLDLVAVERLLDVIIGARAFIASTAVATVANAVIRTTGISGCSRRLDS